MTTRDVNRDERGSTVPLIIGFAVVLLILVAVVVDATAAFVDRQRLESLADGAALQGADQGAQGSQVYVGGLVGQRLAVTEAAARRAVGVYVAQLEHTPTRQTVRVAPDGSVTVEICEQVELPLGVPGLSRRTTVCGTGRAAVTRDG